MAFLLCFTVNAFGANANRKCDVTAGTGGSGCDNANNFIVVAPYWQVDSGSYTFIAVTHSSLSGMASQIGLRINAITSSGAAYDAAETFTIEHGSTERLFIVPTTHATINATAIPTAKFMTGTSDFTYGSLRVNPVMTVPGLKFHGGFDAGFDTNQPGGNGFRDITMLSYWGSIIIEQNTTGFAMEFLGDMNDSTAVPDNFAFTDAEAVNSGQGLMKKDLYRPMSTGPNLQ